MSSKDARAPRSNRARATKDDSTGPGEDRFLLLATVAWFLVTFMRVQDILPFLKVTAPGMLATLSVTIAMVSRWRQVRWSDPIIKAFLVMLVGMSTGVAFALNTYWLFNDFLTVFTYGIVFLMALPILMRNRYCATVMIKTVAASAFVTAIWGVTHSGHGQGAWLGDENDVALFTNVGICFCYFAARGAQSPRERRFLLLAAAVCAAGTIFSFSRGGFVGLLVGVVAIGVYSGRLIKVLSITALLVLALLPVLATLHPPEGRGKSRSYLDELTSISDTSDNTRLERIYTWTGGWVMFKANPIFGVGAGNYPYTLGSYEDDPELKRLNIFDRSFGGRAAHSLYFTMLAELGSVGSGAFLVMWFTVIRRTWKLCRAGDPGLPPGLAAGVGAALLSYAACSAFVSAFYYPPFWLLCGFACGMYSPTKQPQVTESSDRKTGKRLAQVAKPSAQVMPANRR